jgi:hypothetical protein
MYILVDHDNIPDRVKRKGLRGMVDRFAELAMTQSADPGDMRLDVKFYGGWFEYDRLTKMAQELSSEIRRQFPYALFNTKSSPARKVTVNASLAFSLESLPKKTLTNTFRSRSPARKMTCAEPSGSGCTARDCPLSPVVGFVDKNSCPEAGCPVTPQNIFRGSGQQKLVDTMLVADVIFLAKTDPMLFVVTNDDDVWPGLISAMVLGSTIIHINTDAGSSGSDYRTGVPGKYFQLPL